MRVSMGSIAGKETGHDKATDVLTNIVSNEKL